MINLRQIAVLLGTGAAVAGVLALPDHAITKNSEPVVVVEVDTKKPQRRPAAEMAPVKAEGVSDEARRLSVAELAPATLPAPRADSAVAEASPASTQARVAKAQARLAEIDRAQGPVPASADAAELPFERHSDLVFATEASFSRIDGTGITTNSTARLLSNMNLGGDVSWRQHWSEKFSTRIGLGFSRVDFQGAPNSKTIDQKGKTFGRMLVGANYCLGDRWEMGAGLGIRQEIFYVATGATTLRIDQVAVPRAEASVRYDVIKLSPFSMGMGARSAYLFATSADGYAVKAGSSHRLSLHIKEESAEGRLRPTGEIFYDLKKQDTNLNRKTEKEIGLQLGITWKFGP